MIERYTLPEMANIWALENKYETWLAVELSVLEAQEELGLVPAGTATDVRAKARFSKDRINEIEAEVKHDVIAFLTNVAEHVGENSRYVHLGLTSSDLVDTAFSLQIRQAGELILTKLSQVRQTLMKRAQEHRYTAMIGRSHGIHAEPITFGLKLLVWIDALDRQERRLKEALEENRLGQFTGAVGTYSNIDPKVEQLACGKLGLHPAKTTTQVIQRDIHAEFILALASLAGSIEQFATEIRHLQRTDVLEAEEPFTPNQKGSSAMPHKRNPVGSENLTGLARLIRGATVPALENIALWHERDISHSSVERVIFPDCCILIHYMLNRFNLIMQDLVLYPENMLRNMHKFGGVIFSQRVLLTLIERGQSREAAYRIVQRNAHQAWNTLSGNFRENLLQDPEVTKVLTSAEVEACFDIQDYLKHVDTLFARFDFNGK